MNEIIILILSIFLILMHSTHGQMREYLTPPTTTTEQAEEDKAKAEEERKMALRRKGRGSTILSTGKDLGEVNVEKKTLLGR